LNGARGARLGNLFRASGLDGAAALLAFGPGTAIVAFAATATATAAPPTAALTVALIALITARRRTPFGAGLWGTAPGTAIIVPVATLTTATTAVAAIAIATLVVAGADRRGVGGRLIAAEETLEPAQETTGFLLRLGPRLGPRFGPGIAWWQNLGMPGFAAPIVASGFAAATGILRARLAGVTRIEPTAGPGFAGFNRTWFAALGLKGWAFGPITTRGAGGGGG